MYVHLKMSHCWKSYVAAHLCLLLIPKQFKDSYKTDINVDDFVTVDHRYLEVSELISLRDVSGSS